MAETAEAPAVAVLFDFDGTLADTERAALEVAFWALAPFVPSLRGTSPAALDRECAAFVRNAGKPFEAMLRDVEADRARAGLEPVDRVWPALGDDGVAAAVRAKRKALGLPPLPKTTTSKDDDDDDDDRAPTTIVAQQRADTIARLARTARPTEGATETLDRLGALGVPCVVATTSAKDRVAACLDAAGLRDYFPSDLHDVHSGESDFGDAPKLKPAPDVYRKAAASVGRAPSRCVAVEDSPSGVGSAANAGVGVIVGYVGAAHVVDKAAHAGILLSGERSWDGRGADVVVSRLIDIVPVVEALRRYASSSSSSSSGDSRRENGGSSSAEEEVKALRDLARATLLESSAAPHCWFPARRSTSLKDDTV